MATVIFVGSPEKSPKSCAQKFKSLFLVPPHDVIFRVFAAFVPPVSKKYQKVYVDLQGPVLALVLLAALLNYGYSFKPRNTFRSPTETVVIYSLTMPLLAFFVCKIGRSCITLSEMTSLIGYGLYGHIFTLFVSFLLFEEASNFFFFVCLIVFGGLSTLRIALVVLGTLFVPAARLLICSLISICNILFVIFLHFAYMHRTFIS
ncbi:protein YIPF3-like [Tribolium castaneum]|uniref:Protein YIPF3-like Protein n=1 Tax=Tribolium castaneum TaxID=7070 RepID=D6X1X9_TRICA|nr:PREDICTED: protein YIPF3 isoform X1 [Tribolium castaneum]EFA09950.1 Protein YIPF3-like Protein [Tribolium castaneum]|eukprot:XP_015838718.1 PREDICTED: protein YIPF3 isoform X1 [Tribolium castaneum]